MRQLGLRRNVGEYSSTGQRLQHFLSVRQGENPGPSLEGCYDLGCPLGTRAAVHGQQPWEPQPEARWLAKTATAEKVRRLYLDAWRRCVTLSWRCASLPTTHPPVPGHAFRLPG